MAYMNLLEVVYPVGSIYMSILDTSPATLIGGSWSKLTNAFLATSGTIMGEAGTTSGSNFIQTENLPSHKHSITTNGAHVHSMKYAVQLPTSGSVWTPKTQASESTDGSTTGYMASAGSHTHTIGSTGDGERYVPSHYTVNAWRRTA